MRPVPNENVTARRLARFRALFPWSIAAIIATVAIVPLIVMGYVGYTSAAQALRSDAKTRLAEVASHTSNQIDALLLERWGDTKVMSESIAARSMSPPAVRHLMEVAAGSYAPNYELLLVADSHGRVIAAYDPPASHAEPAERYVGRDVNAAPWFKRALRSDTVVVTETKSPMLPELANGSLHNEEMGLAHAIRNDSGVAVGVWINFVAWAIVEKIVNQSVVESHAEGLDVVLLNRYGRAIASNQTPDVIAPLANGDPNAQRTMTAIASGQVVEVPARDLFNGDDGSRRTRDLAGWCSLRKTRAPPSRRRWRCGDGS